MNVVRLNRNNFINADIIASIHLHLVCDKEDSDKYALLITKNGKEHYVDREYAAGLNTLLGL